MCHSLSYIFVSAHSKKGSLCRVPLRQGTRQMCRFRQLGVLAYFLLSWIILAHGKDFAMCPKKGTAKVALPAGVCCVLPCAL